MKIIYDLIIHSVGIQYKWAGNNSLEGWDCSGYICELLRSGGVIGTEDLTAQDIYNKFEKNGSWNIFQLGSLLFFGESVLKIKHVGMCVDAYVFTEAGGGNRDVDTLDEARAKSAMVRIRPIKSRTDLVAVIKPSYASIGMA